MVVWEYTCKQVKISQWGKWVAAVMNLSLYWMIMGYLRQTNLVYIICKSNVSDIFSQELNCARSTSWSTVPIEKRIKEKIYSLINTYKGIIIWYSMNKAWHSQHLLAYKNFWWFAFTSWLIIMFSTAHTIHWQWNSYWYWMNHKLNPTILDSCRCVFKH